MKLYDFTLAPSPRRVRIFLAEKGVEIPRVQVNLREREQFAPEFVKTNANRTVPVLELDDGTRIAESVAICRYIEELNPDPPLMGVGAKERALVEMWNRRVEFEGYLAIADVLRNTNPMFAERGLPGVPDAVPQIPALGERGRATVNRLFAKLNAQLAHNEYIAGPRFSIADITALVSVDFAARVQLSVPEEFTELHRWYRLVAARPSANA